MHYRDYLKKELEKRQKKNKRYSLRAYARDLGVSVTALSQLLSGKRDLSGENLSSALRALRVSKKQTEVFLSQISRHESNEEDPQESDLLEPLKKLPEEYLERVLKGENIQIDHSENNAWKYTFVFPLDSDKITSPEAAAAVYWDVKGLPGYLSGLKMRAMKLLTGANTAVRRFFNTVTLTDDQGTSMDFSFAREYTLTKRGTEELPVYQITFRSADLARQVFPGVYYYHGTAFFSYIPQASEPKLALSIAWILVADLHVIQSTRLKKMVHAACVNGFSSQVRKVKQGATLTQLKALRTALN